MKYLNLIFLPISLMTLSCSSMTLSVNSEPTEAAVYIKDGKKLKKLGVTPLQVEASTMREYDQYNLSIQKEGFQSHDIMIDRRILSADAKVFANLQKKSSKELSQEGTGGRFDKQQRSLASVQSQLLQKNYPQAEILAKSFLGENPYSPVGWNLLGNAYLLQNRNAAALEAYQQALEYDPENKDTIKMVEYLSGIPVRRDR